MTSSRGLVLWKCCASINIYVSFDSVKSLFTSAPSVKLKMSNQVFQVESRLSVRIFIMRI